MDKKHLMELNERLRQCEAEMEQIKAAMEPGRQLWWIGHTGIGRIRHWLASSLNSGKRQPKPHDWPTAHGLWVFEYGQWRRPSLEEMTRIRDWQHPFDECPF